MGWIATLTGNVCGTDATDQVQEIESALPTDGPPLAEIVYAISISDSAPNIPEQTLEEIVHTYRRQIMNQLMIIISDRSNKQKSL